MSDFNEQSEERMKANLLGVWRAKKTEATAPRKDRLYEPFEKDDSVIYTYSKYCGALYETRT